MIKRMIAKAFQLLDVDRDGHMVPVITILDFHRGAPATSNICFLVLRTPGDKQSGAPGQQVQSKIYAWSEILKTKTKQSYLLELSKVPFELDRRCAAC